MDPQDKYILRKIKREYSKDESVAALLKIIADLRVEVGQYISDNQEIKHRYSKLEISLSQRKDEIRLKIAREESKRANLSMQKSINTLSKENESLRNIISKLKSKATLQPQK